MRFVVKDIKFLFQLIKGFPPFVDVTQVQQAIHQREEMLQPLYTQVACEFADLHDKAGRMKAMGAIRESTLAWRRCQVASIVFLTCVDTSNMYYNMI